MRFFKVEVGLSNPQLHTTLLAHPKLLDYSVDDVMRPSLQCLKANLGLPKPSLAAVITKAPRALQYPFESLEAKLLWYKTVMGFTKVELQKLVCLHPRYELLLLVTRHCCYCSLYKALQQHCCRYCCSYWCCCCYWCWHADPAASHIVAIVPSSAVAASQHCSSTAITVDLRLVHTTRLLGIRRCKHCALHYSR
jgi:mTERF